MRIGWMPYLELAYPLRGPKVLEVGKARFLPDSDDVWANEVKRPRPSHLNMFREFPPVTSDEAGSPIRGTIVLCEDEDWLKAFLDEAVAVVYFLGDRPQPGQPAERFAYHSLNLKNDAHNPAQIASFVTKHGELWEDEKSIVIYPPLVVRGSLGQYPFDVKREEHKKLLEVFRSNPQDRLIVAVRQYFRTQFSDVFTSTIQDDYSTHCSVIEAALNIDTRHMAADKFVDALTAKYGADGGFGDFFLGMYVARSLHVHGATSQAASTGATKEQLAYLYFMSRRAKLTALRVLSRDVILTALGRPADPFGFESLDSAKPILCKVMQSDTIWDQAKRLLIQGGAANVFSKMTDVEFTEVENLAISMSSNLEWGCVSQVVDRKHVFKAIGTCALMIARLTNSVGPIYDESDRLGKAADAGDVDAIQKWTIDNYEWTGIPVREGDRLTTFQVLAALLAAFLEPRG